MTILSSEELIALRSHPHVAKFYMSILKPTMIYSGQVTGTLVVGSRFIPLTTISGDIADLVEGYTLKVKDADGNLICKRRYRSRDGNTIKIDENTVAWSSTYVIEAYKQFELWSKFPFIDADDNYTFYKDYDINYSDQHIRIPPVAVMGSHRAGFLENGSVTFTLDASDSYYMLNIPGAPLSYIWSCDTGNIAVASYAVTTITFTTPGYHIVSLKVIDSQHSMQDTHRVFFVHERTGEYAPYVDFDINSAQCSWSEGGCILSATLRGDASIEDIEDNALIVIWSENWYGGVKQDIGENGNIRFVGYVTSDSIQKSINANEVTFEIGTIDVLMKNMSMFSISLSTEYATIQVGDATVYTYNTWFTFPHANLTVAAALHHLWKWHSTLLEVTDVLLPVENVDAMMACDDMTDGSLFTLADWAYDNGIFAKAYCDQVGKFHVDIDSLILDKTSRDALDTYIDITAQDWRFESGIQIDRRKESNTALVVASGIARINYEYIPLMAQAPGIIPNNFGDETVNVERLVLQSQTQLNTLVGRLYAIANSDISEIRLEFSGDYPVTLSPKVWYTLTIPASYTKRGIDIDVRMQCRSITYNVSVTSGVIYPSCIFEVDVESIDGVTLTYPDDTETPYSPVPAYTPAVPYLPDVPVVYPIIPISPYPNYPNGPPTSIIPGAPTIPAINSQCRTILSYSPNGPYLIYSGDTGAGSTIIPISFFLRGTNYTNPTKYTINGNFYSVDPDDGSYVSTTDDDYYDVYALDDSGTRVAVGVHDPVVGNGYQRTGTFNAPAGVNISAIEVTCNSPQPPEEPGVTRGSYPPIYVAVTNQGEYDYIITPDNLLAQQVTDYRVSVGNPPWVWDVSIGVEFSMTWLDVVNYPAWFEWAVILYPSQTDTAYYIAQVKNIYNSTLVELTDHEEDEFSGKFKLTGSGELDYLKLGLSITYTNVTEVWGSFFSMLQPIVPKISIDSLLLWNVCSHS
jgi:hypothetical protein